MYRRDIIGTKTSKTDGRIDHCSVYVCSEYMFRFRIRVVENESSVIECQAIELTQYYLFFIIPLLIFV